MMNIAITGGGTGGHLSICKSLAQYLCLKNNLIFIGSNNGQDRDWFEDSDIFDSKYFLQSDGVVNKKSFGKIKSVANIVKLGFYCIKIFRKHKIDFIISVGGYSAAPACFGALFAKVPIFIHEQNACIGSVNKIFKPFCKGFYSSYFQPRFDYPVSNDFFKYSRVRTKIDTIIFLGGSQGAEFINNIAILVAPKLKELGIKVIHQCGFRDFKRVKKAYDDMDINVDVFAFSDKIHYFINQADLAIARCGASTLWELCASGLPAIYIPYPNAANNHQYFNAKFLMDLNLCNIILQNEFSLDLLLEKIERYDIRYVSQRLLNLLKDDGCNKIIEDIFRKLK